MDTELVAGIATAVNFIVIYVNFKRGAFEHALIDTGMLALVTYVFLGSATGMATGMIASFIFSMFLIVFPPKGIFG